MVGVNVCGRHRTVWGVVALLTVWLSSFFAFYLSPWGQPALQVQVVSSDSGFSQLFVADDEAAFSEGASSWAVLQRGQSTLHFPLKLWRGTVGTELRWDPLDRPAEMTVSSIRLVSGPFHEDVPLDLLQPSMAVSEISTDDSGATFVVQSNDPQILIDLETAPFVGGSAIRGALLASLIAGMALAVAWTVRSRKSRVGHGAYSATRPKHWQDDVAAIANVPRWVVAVSAAVTALGTLLLLLGSQAIGVSWDEPIHEFSLEEYFRSGWFVPRGSFIDGVPSVADASVYAPVGALFAHAWGAITGAHPWFEASFTAEAYRARHLAVALISVVGLLALAATARAMFRSWRWTLVVLATCVSIPLFLGHSMFNIKDAPVAAAFTCFTLGLVLLVRGGVARKPATLSFLAQLLGIFLGIGNRPGIWIAFAVSSLFSVLLIGVLDWRRLGVRPAATLAGKRLGVVALSAAVGYLLLWAVYPIAFDDPLTILRDSLVASQEFPWSGATLTAGSFVSAQPPWTYVPVWLGAQLPVLVAVFSLVGLGWLIVTYIRSVAQRRDTAVLTASGVPVILQALAVPIGAVLLGSTLYGGVRQFLFIFPALSLLTAVGLLITVEWLRTRARPWVVTALWVGVLIGVLVPLLAQLRLFPYSFAYFNAAASAGDIDRNWDVDGWWLSGRELVENQRFPDRTICVDSAERAISSCSRMEMVTPFLSEFGGSDIDLQEDQYVALSRFPYPVSQDSCTPFREVTRGLFLQQIQLSHADVCTASLTQYPSEGLSFAGLVKEDPVLLWGWNPYLLWGWGAPDPDGVWMVEPNASIGFVLPTTSVEHSGELSVTLTGSALANDGASLRVFVNGTDSGTLPIPGEAQTDTSILAVPESAWDGLGEDRVIVRLQAEGIDPESLASAVDTGLPGLIRIDDLMLTSSPSA